MQAAGLDLSLNLPNTKLDLGSMPKVSANLNLVDNDVYVAIVVPIMLAGLAVPGAEGPLARSRRPGTRVPGPCAC